MNAGRRGPNADPWEGTRVGELGDPLLPRWFVVLALVSIPAAIAAAVAAVVVFGPDQVDVAARRPPPAPPLTTAVGDFVVGDRPPQPLQPACPTVAGIRAAGTPTDVRTIAAALAALCEVTLPLDIAERLAAFGAADGVVRFAQFAATGVDSTLLVPDGSEAPVVLVNARFARGTDPRWIAPLLVHDTTFVALEAGTVAAALTARRAEAVICDRVLADARRSRGCEDAAALLASPEPAAALRRAGFMGDG